MNSRRLLRKTFDWTLMKLKARSGARRRVAHAVFICFSVVFFDISAVFSMWMQNSVGLLFQVNLFTSEQSVEIKW